MQLTVLVMFQIQLPISLCMTTYDCDGMLRILNFILFIMKCCPFILTINYLHVPRYWLRQLNGGRLFEVEFAM